MENTTIPIPDTVGEMIEFLKKFPKDWSLDVYHLEYDYYSSSETCVYHMTPKEYSTLGSLSLTFS